MWVMGEAEALLCEALGSASIPASTHRSLFPPHFIASQGTGLCSVISPLILPSPLRAALGLPPFLSLYQAALPGLGGSKSTLSPASPTVKDVPSLPGLGNPLSSSARW